jgi:hypothetical protein
MNVEPNSVRLVAPQGDSKGFDKKYQEKWLIYCPAIADDTLLYMITALESYSIRSYGGHLGVNASGRHADGIHTTSEFMEQLQPDRVYEVTWLERPVTKAAEWSEFIDRKWDSYRDSHGLAAPA